MYPAVFTMREEDRYSQQLVTAKLLATSRLSMCGVSLKSAIPNWTMPTLNALYSWSAPLGNKPPETERERQSEAHGQTEKTTGIKQELHFTSLKKTENLII